MFGIYSDESKTVDMLLLLELMPVARNLVDWALVVVKGCFALLSGQYLVFWLFVYMPASG